MDAQPDLEKLSGALTTASHEIGLFRNVPNFNDGQRLFQAIERLSTSINNLGTQVGTLRTEVVTLRTEMNAKFDTLELRMSAESAHFSAFSSFLVLIFYSSLNHTARIYNSHISNRNTPLRMILDQRKMMVEGFPRDPAHLMQLTGKTKYHIEKLYISN